MEESKAKLYAVIGNPIKHSLSPLLHQNAFDQLGISANYYAYNVESSDLHAFMKIFKGETENNFTALKPSELGLTPCDIKNIKQEFSGLSVTLPHKKAILDFVDNSSDLVKLVGAANTLYVQYKKIYAENTDLAGFLAPLKKYYQVDLDFQSEKNNTEKYLQKNKALVLGAGGAAAAVLVALCGLKDFDKIYLCARRTEQAQDILENLKINSEKNNFNFPFAKIEIIPFADREICADLIVNTIPPSELSPRINFENVKIAYDLTYGMTSFLSMARSANCQIINGEEMFITQGKLQFYLWTKQEIPEQSIDKVRTEIAKRTKVIYGK